MTQKLLWEHFKAAVARGTRNWWNPTWGSGVGPRQLRGIRSRQESKACRCQTHCVATCPLYLVTCGLTACLHPTLVVPLATQSLPGYAHKLVPGQTHSGDRSSRLLATDPLHMTCWPDTSI